MPGDQHGVVRKDRWDRRQYAGLRRQSPVLQEAEQRLGEQVPGPLVEDTWAALFKARPELLKPVPAAEALLGQVMSALMDLPEYHEARQWTRLDEWASALGAAHLARKVEEWLQGQPSGSGAGGGGTGAGQYGAQPSREAGAEGGAAGSEGSQTAGSVAGEEAVEALRAQLREGLADLAGVGGVLWGTAPGQARRVTGRQAEAADRLLRDAAFRRMARMAGRMYTGVLTRKLARGRDGVVPAGVVLGSDLSRVLPEDLVSLRHPVLRRDFLARYAEGRLRQLDVRQAPQERGPVICCVDVSGSMAGKKYEWAKAVALALLRVARRERRPFTGILFDAAVHGIFRLSPGGEPAEVERFAALYGGGGTSFRWPLEDAVAEMRRQRRADVVFITDGQASLDGWLEQFLEQKRRLGFRVFGVFVSSGQSGGQGGLNTLRKFSDAVLSVSPAPDGAGLEMVFDAV